MNQKINLISSQITISKMDSKMIEHKISLNDRQVWFLNGFYHREDGPAVIDEFLGVKEWRINGQLHREDGPAIIWEDGTQLWYQNGKRHRTDGPAVIYADGKQQWCQNGALHRTDGPAIIWEDGGKEWWINGELVQPPSKFAINELQFSIKDGF